MAVHLGTTPAVKDSILPGPLYTGLCGIFVILVLYELWFQNTDGYKKLKQFPGPLRLPWVGQGYLAFGLSNSEIMAKALEYMARHGDIIGGTLGYRLIVGLSNPHDIEVILNSEEHLEKAVEYKYFKPWFGNGLLISKGDHWRHHRKMIAPTFHQSILKSFIPTFANISQRVTDELVKLVGQEIDIHKHMSETSVQILLTTAMGVKKLPAAKKCSEYAEAVISMCDIIHKRQVKLLYRWEPVFKLTKMSKNGRRLLNIIRSLTKRVITERDENFNWEKDSVMDSAKPLDNSQVKQTGLRDDLDDIDESDVGAKRRLAFLDAMLDMSKDPNVEWNYQDVVDEVNTIMFEGHDTTSAASSFVLCLLGIHQDVQDKVYEEQIQIFGSHMQRACTFSDTLEMNYLERVIKETLRLYPPVPIIARKVNRDVKLASGPYTIPKGATVVIGQYSVQRHPDFYENPDKFDPDNFLNDRVTKRPYYTYIPFSAGARSCVGRKYAMLMLKVLLSTILRRFRVHTNLKESDFKMQADIILKMSDGFNIVLESRI